MEESEKKHADDRRLYESFSQVLKNIERVHDALDAADFSTFSDADLHRVLYSVTTVELEGQKYSVDYDRGSNAIVWTRVGVL